MRERDEMLKTYLEKNRITVDEALERYLPETRGFGSRVQEAMRYSLFSGGKRLRPCLALMVCEALEGREENALPAACALEMIHTYSLIHDDLPSMDNDDFRRGRPSCHKAFDEATAVLAGDGLLTRAFEVVARETPDSRLVPALVSTIGAAAGPSGMVLGQMRDLEAEGREPDLAMVKAIHETKTAAMISASIEVGAISALAGAELRERLAEAGRWIGLAFQVIDDILDIVGTTQELGKTAGKDREEGKLTYPSAVGLDASREAAREMTEKALSLLDPPDSFVHVRELVVGMLHRTC